MPPDVAFLNLRVTPRAGRDELTGWVDGTLRLRVRAAPVDGKANDAVCRLLASALGLPPSALMLVGGAGARSKRVRVEGLTQDEALRRLGAG